MIICLKLHKLIPACLLVVGVTAVLQYPVIVQAAPIQQTMIDNKSSGDGSADSTDNTDGSSDDTTTHRGLNAANGWNSGGKTASTDNMESADKCNKGFLTFPAWYDGLTKDDGSCDIKSPTEAGGLSKFIWTIALNIVEIMLNLVGYASVGFIIYGGYRYLISAGSPDGMVTARKTIMNAVIGLVISIVSVAIVNTIAGNLK